MKGFKYIITGLLMASLIQSCDLDKFPANSIEQSQSFQSVSDAEKWTNNFYAQLRGRIYGTFTVATDVQSDLLNATSEFGNNYGAVHRWAAEFNSDNYEIRDVWQGYYAALKNVNLSIEKFPTIPIANETEKTKLNQYLGEAHLTRAYYFLNLALRYCKPYSNSAANSDLGIPLVLKYDLTAMPNRATLKETYEQILSDISKAKELLVNVTGKPGSNYFTIDAVYALEARTKLYMQDLNGAKTAAEEVIKTGKYKLYNTAQGIQSMWATDANQETIVQLFCSLTERPNQNSIYYGYDAANKRYRSMFIPSKWVVDSYSSNDLRKSVYFKEADLYQNGKSYKVSIVNKYPGNPALITSTTENHNAPKLFRAAELYLISAEASVVSDPALALTRLNDLRVARGLGALSGLNGQALMDEVRAERFRELAFEGGRLDDLKRWGLAMTRKDPQGTDFLQTGEGYISKSVPAGDDKFVWGIPAYDMLLNPNLVPNKGW